MCVMADLFPLPLLTNLPIIVIVIAVVVIYSDIFGTFDLAA
jgi:hypothetical protein